MIWEHSKKKWSYRWYFHSDIQQDNILLWYFKIHFHCLFTCLFFVFLPNIQWAKSTELLRASCGALPENIEWREVLYLRFYQLYSFQSDQCQQMISGIGLPPSSMTSSLLLPFVFWYLKKVYKKYRLQDNSALAPRLKRSCLVLSFQCIIRQFVFNNIYAYFTISWHTNGNTMVERLFFRAVSKNNSIWVWHF